MKKSWWRSLKVKIIAWSFVPAVIILSAVAWFTFYSYQKVIEDLAIQKDQEILQSKVNQFRQAINELVTAPILQVYLEIDTNHQLPLDVRAQQILDQTQGLEIFDGGILFLDQQGKIFRTDPPQPELLGQDWSNTTQFRFITEHPNATGFTDLLTVGSSGEKIACVNMALLGQKGELVGATYYCFAINPAVQNAFYQHMYSQNLGSGIYVMDRYQNIIFSADLSEMGKNVSEKNYILQLLEGESMSGRFPIEGRDFWVSYVPVSNDQDAVSLILVKEQDWAEVMRPSLAYRQLLIILLALGVIVPALVTGYGVRFITNPIQKLNQAAGQVTAGQFKHRIEVNTGDEIATLADQFNMMSAKLDESYSLLEQKVADRTRELAVMNAIISVASHSLDIQEILEDALSQTVEQMGFDAGAAFRLEPDSVSAFLTAYRGFEPAAAENLMSGIITVKDERQVVLSPRTISAGSSQDDALANQVRQSGYHLLATVPLSTKGQALGLFLLARQGPGQLSSEEISLLSAIGQQIGVAIENAHLYERAEQTAIASERTRLARELHDAVTQTLFSASLIADVIPRVWKRDQEEGLRNLNELRLLNRGALAEMRTLLLEMRPESLARADLKSLLTQLANAFTGRVRIPLDLVINGHCGLPQDVKVAFYRVAQEALNNIAKHSGARQASLHLDCQPGYLSLCVQDDGLGFEPDSIPPDHLGIAIMRERASSIGACLRIESQSGQGTTVLLDWRPARKDGTDE